MNTIETEIVTVTPDLETMDRADTLAIWGGYKEKIEQLKEAVSSALSADPTLATSAKVARAVRLDLRKIRIGIEHRRKELTEGLHKKKVAIDTEAKLLTALIEPNEDKLLEIEQHAEKIEAERLRKLAADRVAELAKFTTISNVVDYGAMPEDEFDKMLSDAKALHELRQAEAKRAEELRIAKEKAEAEERERIRLENERLRKEAAEKEAALAAQKAAEEKKRKAEEMARKKAAAAPDREKLLALAEIIRGHRVPELSTQEGRCVGMEIAEKFASLATWIESEAADL